MVNRKLIYLFLCSLIFMFLSFFINVKIGKALEGACVDCHTMHNSQNGTAVVGEGPYRALTTGDCVVCHSDSGPATVPTVVSMSSEPQYTFGAKDDVTAGGNFYWVIQSGGDAKGHNVNGTGATLPDSNIGSYTPPGYVPSYGTYGRSHSWEKALTCAGTYGCHGDPNKEDPFASISGAHHGNELCNSTAGNCDGSTVAKSYRFLLGIKGTEDPDWELTLSTTDHNGYYAVDEDSDSGPADTASINYLCGECHGQFHKDTEGSNYASPWLRHPTDYDMNNVSSKEYGQYPNTTLFSGKLGVSNTGDYFAEVPVGNKDGVVKSQVLQGGDDAIVLCISCHRAHATPYDDILRWDYSKCTAGSQNADCGCFACHTSK